MRKQDKIVLWPLYFDSTKTRLEGRRVPKNMATSAPRLDEVQRAVERTGFRPETVPNAAHPSTWWQKTGFVIVPKKNTKAQTIRKVAKELQKLRAQT